ncbi:acetylxylan esterase [Gracilibacillus sp. D59]|uniref:acetylxylan esterase n=1 Tax=Gracilibacillus sp. D59 TaxID=3457434 RepID=UPI003FCD66C9
MSNYIEQMIKQYQSYNPVLTKKHDHDTFWRETYDQTRKKPLNSKLKELDYPIQQVYSYELTYHGFDETPIKAHYLLPKESKNKLPCLIFFHGYAGSKGSVSDYMKWLIQGYAIIAVDCRGQGKSGDYSNYSSNEMGSWVTQGILNKKEYYYRKVYMDGVRAIDFACTRSEIDHNRIALIGTSMGGGITLAVAALDNRPKLAIADIPNMCDIELAIHEKLEGSLTILERFLDRHTEQIDQVFSTLSYFDNLNLAPNINCRIRVSAGLKDPVCPPKTIFGVYNHINAPKTIEVYPFAQHFVHHEEHIKKTLLFVNEYL